MSLPNEHFLSIDIEWIEMKWDTTIFHEDMCDIMPVMQDEGSLSAPFPVHTDERFVG